MVSLVTNFEGIWNDIKFKKWEIIHNFFVFYLKLNMGLLEKIKDIEDEMNKT